MTEETLEDRFRKVGDGSVRFMATRQEVLEFIENEIATLKETIRSEIAQYSGISNESTEDLLNLECLKK